ncbi:MAG TPA: ATP-grasp domain-containing protein [Myxococcota bacterium]|jgi:biotin carboxylase|nr:ATP-grasp domain-containing protein [Myxococcota bacterium]
MNVVFLSPAYPPEMQMYVRGLAEVGAAVWGVGDAHRDALPAALRGYLSDYLQVPRILDEEDVTERMDAWLHGRTVDRLVTNWEPLVLLAARLRERYGVPGMGVDAVRGFRDKQLMKERVAAAGLRVPRSARVRTSAEAWEAAERVGWPLVVKPIAGAGSADTFRVDSRQEMEAVLAQIGHVAEASVEEYVEGDEFTFDSVCVDGTPVFENVAQYLPKPLLARTNEWISPVIITVRDMAQPELQPGIALGRQVLAALGMGTGFTHMEWFRTAAGEAVFGEIGCRPGGAHLVDQMNYTCDVDLFREWARATCHGAFQASKERKYNCGIVFKRALGQGRITRVTGLEEYRRRFGSGVMVEALLPVGARRRNWKQTLLSDGHIIVRDPDWDECYRMSFAAATDITMFAGG